MCLHEQFEVNARVARLTDSEESEIVTGYHVDITIHCSQCYKPFEFIGLTQGFSPGYPTTNPDNTEVRMPIKPVH